MSLVSVSCGDTAIFPNKQLKLKLVDGCNNNKNNNNAS